MTRTEIIQGLIGRNGYKSYLEIGVNTPAQPGYSHDSIKVETKHGVDPNVDTTFRMTSDDFFAQNRRKYDIVFIDGDHIYEQALRDIVNALACLEEGGTIVVHDCNPTTEITQRRVRASDAWHGDVWKAIVAVQLMPGVIVQTIDADEGCAIITKGERDPFEFLDANRKALLSLISAKQWQRSQS